MIVRPIPSFRAASQAVSGLQSLTIKPFFNSLLHSSPSLVSFRRNNSTETASKYAGAGILSPNSNKGGLVDVTNVLVIGSGGLSIGQAGEFDYSGKLLLIENSS